MTSAKKIFLFLTVCLCQSVTDGDISQMALASVNYSEEFWESDLLSPITLTEEIFACD